MVNGKTIDIDVDDGILNKKENTARTSKFLVSS